MPPPAHHEQLVQETEPSSDFRMIVLPTHSPVLKRHIEHGLDLGGVDAPVAARLKRAAHYVLNYLFLSP